MPRANHNFNAAAPVRSVNHNVCLAKRALEIKVD